MGRRLRRSSAGRGAFPTHSSLPARLASCRSRQQTCGGPIHPQAVSGRSREAEEGRAREKQLRAELKDLRAENKQREKEALKRVDKGDKGKGSASKASKGRAAQAAAVRVSGLSLLAPHNAPGGAPVENPESSFLSGAPRPRSTPAQCPFMILHASAPRPRQPPTACAPSSFLACCRRPLALGERVLPLASRPPADRGGARRETRQEVQGLGGQRLRSR